MLKPKNHLFKVKIMINKLQAINNKVSSRCLATLKIDNQEISFKSSPQFKKNVALFNSQVQYDHFSLYFDQVTALYQNKTVTIVMEIETQGTKIKIGEVVINMGEILNEKKYRIVNYYPLTKCYDKAAKLKLSVDFIPIPTLNAANFNLKSQRGSNKQKSQFTLRNVDMQHQQVTNVVNKFDNSSLNQKSNQIDYKSRMAQQSGNILQQKLYEYEQKLDNYRLSQTQLQERMHEQIAIKDDQITSLNIELSNKNQSISHYSLQNQQLRYRLKEAGQELSHLKQTNKSLVIMVQNSQNQQQVLRKQCHSLKISLENHAKTKQNKQKYYNQQLTKYTQRYLQSQQERNRIIFQLQSKFKEQTQKKDQNYKNLMSTNDKKYNQIILGLKQRTKKLQQEVSQKQSLIQHANLSIKKLNDNIVHKTKQHIQLSKKYEQTNFQLQKLSKLHSEQTNQLQTINFSYQEMQKEYQKLKEEHKGSLKLMEQLKMQIVMANQTIEEQRKNITKFTKQLQVHQERQYFLTEKYQDQLQIKSIHEENIRGESSYYREEIYKLKNKLSISQQRLQQQTHKCNKYEDTIHRLEMEISNKNQNLIALTQEKLVAEKQIKYIKAQLQEMEETLFHLKQENMHLHDNLRDKNMALENDKSLEWSYKIEQLQEDISQMLQKFKAEKDILKDNFKKEENKKKEEILILNQMIKKNKEEIEGLRKTMTKKDMLLKSSQTQLSQMHDLLRSKTQQAAQYKQKCHSIDEALQQMEDKVSKKQQQNRQLLREFQGIREDYAKQTKKQDNIKLNMNKIISYLLDYISKPKLSHLTHLQLSNSQLDNELITIINISIKKYCEEHNRFRDQLKQLQKQSNNHQNHNQYKQFKIIENNNKSFFEKKYHDESNHASIKNKTFYDKEIYYKFNQPFMMGSPKDQNYETEALRDENSKLKKQISELKVKIRGIEQDYLKVQRNNDNEQYLKQNIKNQMQQLQDEVQKIRFQLKKKQKIIIEYQNEMKQLQMQLLSYKNTTTFTNAANKNNNISQSKVRQRGQTRNNSHIKDLQLKIQQKIKQSQLLLFENNKYKIQISNLKQQIFQLSSQLKNLETKLRDKNIKFSALQQQFNNYRSTLQLQYNNQFIKYKTAINNLQQDRLSLAEDNKRNQIKIKQLQSDLIMADKKNKSSKEQNLANVLKIKKQYQSNIAQIKEEALEKQNKIEVINRQFHQLNNKYKQLLIKNTNLTNLGNKKNEEIQKNVQEINIKNKKIYDLQEKNFESSKKYEHLIGQLKQNIQQLQEKYTKKDYELEQHIFTSQTKILELQKRLEDALLSNKL